MVIIKKYNLKKDYLQILNLPKGYQILCVRVEQDIPVIFVQEDYKETKKPCLIHTLQTGQEVTKDLSYIGSYEIYGIINHVYLKR